MDRAKALSALWPYLPTFRIVGELEHITQAAEVLGVSASAVSRTISLVEAETGRPLFVRTGRRIALNEAGRELLRAVRLSMRAVDEGLTVTGDGRLEGEVRLGSVEPFTSVLAVPTLTRLVQRHPAVVPVLTRLGRLDASSMLLQGSIDVAIVRAPPRGAEIRAEKVASLATSAYVSRAHPVLSASSSLEEIARAPRIEVRRARSEPSPWPPSLSGRVGLWVPDDELAARACSSSSLVAVLPELLVAPLVTTGALVRLSNVPTSPLELWAWYREPIGQGSRVDAVAEAMREAIAEIAPPPL